MTSPSYPPSLRPALQNPRNPAPAAPPARPPGAAEVGALLQPPPARLGSVDAYRGFVMLLMMAEVLHLSGLAGSELFRDHPVWQQIKFHTSHVAWVGCALHDMIQPSFSFLVGVALPFSLASRAAKGQSTGLAILHAAWRALALTLLGVFLRSVGRNETNWTFEDTLSQIGLGYLPLFLLGLASARWAWIAFGVITVGYWGAFAAYSPPAGFDPVAAKVVPANWPHNFEGFAAHWNLNANLAWAVDTWFLNLFPRPKEFTHNGGGYATLSFIPTLATMILGLIAGRTLRSDWPGWKKIGLFVLLGAAFTAAGFGADWFGICPCVKKIWTSGWVLYSGGICLLMLAGFYMLVDGIGLAALWLPLRVIGLNSIAAYVIAHLWEGFIMSMFKTHLGQDIYLKVGRLIVNLSGYAEFPKSAEIFEPVARGIFVLTTMWLILFWMYRRKIFLKI